MFMVKEEFKNTKQLLKVKLRVSERAFLWYLAFACGLLTYFLLPNIVQVLTTPPYGAVLFPVNDFSYVALFAVVSIAILMPVLSGNDNFALAVLPQTNNSRLISTLLLRYIIVIFLCVLTVAMHLIRYGVWALIDRFREDVSFALSFHLEFLIVGFFAFLMYSFLIVAACELIAACFRKWTIYAIITVASLFVLIFTKGYAFTLIPQLGIITLEPVFAWFMVKAIALWVFVTALTLIINRYTIYYKVKKKPNSVAGGVVFAIILSVMLFFTPAMVNMPMRVWTNLVQINDMEQIYIDASHLPKGTKLNLATEGITPGHHPALTLESTQGLEDLQGETIVVSYRLPQEYLNRIEIVQHLNPSLEAFLEGDTLNVRYNYDSMFVVILPIWSIAGQFEAYQNRNIIMPDEFGSSYGWRGGAIRIDVQ